MQSRLGAFQSLWDGAAPGNDGRYHLSQDTPCGASRFSLQGHVLCLESLVQINEVLAGSMDFLELPFCLGELFGIGCGCSSASSPTAWKKRRVSSSNFAAQSAARASPGVEAFVIVFIPSGVATGVMLLVVRTTSRRLKYSTVK